MVPGCNDGNSENSVDSYASGEIVSEYNKSSEESCTKITYNEEEKIESLKIMSNSLIKINMSSKISNIEKRYYIYYKLNNLKDSDIMNKNKSIPSNSAVKNSREEKRKKRSNSYKLYKYYSENNEDVLKDLKDKYKEFEIISELFDENTKKNPKFYNEKNKKLENYFINGICKGLKNKYNYDKNKIKLFKDYLSNPEKKEEIISIEIEDT